MDLAISANLRFGKDLRIADTRPLWAIRNDEFCPLLDRVL